jgi:MFS family permease
MGPKTSVIFGMILFCGYVGCFLLRSSILVYVGGVVGGVGSGVAWTGQGVYFALSAERYANEQQLTTEMATSMLAAVFACWILVTETFLESLSTLLVRGWDIPWNVVFIVYFMIAVASSIFMVYQVPDHRNPRCVHEPFFAKATAALRLLVQDPRMKYMVFFNISFGFAGAFLNAFVSSQVVPVAIGKSSVGLLAGIHGMVAAAASIVFGYFDRSKIWILLIGSLAFTFVALPFLFLPDLQRWNWGLLLFVYSMEGIGRATFESTLKALFADYFTYEKEGAFANIILQYGIASTLGYFFVDRMHCSTKSDYCIAYDNGSFHSIPMLSMTVILASILSVFCLLIAYYFAGGNTSQVETEEHRTVCQEEHVRAIRSQEQICSELRELT